MKANPAKFVRPHRSWLAMLLGMLTTAFLVALGVALIVAIGLSIVAAQVLTGAFEGLATAMTMIAMFVLLAMSLLMMAAIITALQMPSLILIFGPAAKGLMAIVMNWMGGG